MIVDSSALVASVRGEPDALEINTLLVKEVVRVSAATLLEASIVVSPRSLEELDALLAQAGAEVVAVDRDQAIVAREAYARYGKGSGSAARLNFGDCFSYALSKVTGEPLLFKGDDFRHTDVTPAR